MKKIIIWFCATAVGAITYLSDVQAQGCNDTGKVDEACVSSAVCAWMSATCPKPVGAGDDVEYKIGRQCLVKSGGVKCAGTQVGWDCAIKSTKNCPKKETCQLFDENLTPLCSDWFASGCGTIGGDDYGECD